MTIAIDVCSIIVLLLQLTWESTAEIEGFCEDDLITLLPERSFHSSTRSPDVKTNAAYVGDNSTSAWCLTSGSGIWFQVDFGEMVIINSVTTRGQHNAERWLTEYSLAFSNDSVTWSFYKRPQVLLGNVDHAAPVTHPLHPPTVIRYLRLYPVSHHGTPACMRLKVNACRLHFWELYYEWPDWATN